MNASKAKGTRWESEIVRTLREYGWPSVERRALAGSHDKGDIAGLPGIVIEAKSTNRYDLAGAVDQANTEAANACAEFGVAWLKRKGKTSARDGYVVMDGETFMQLVAAGELA